MNKVLVLGKNKVVEVERDGEQFYRIIHIPTGKCAVVEHDDKLIDAINNYIMEHRKSLVPRWDTGTLRFPKSQDGTPGISLAAFCYSNYENIPINDVRAFRVLHRTGAFFEDGAENCLKDNLASTGMPVKCNIARSFEQIIIEGQEFLQINLHSYAVSTIVDYSPDFYEFLSRPNNFGFTVNTQGRVQLTLSGTTYKPYLSLVALAFYNGLLRQENLGELREIIEQMTNGGELDADHLNSDLLNNCSCNLSLMQSKINSGKGELANMFYYPYGAYYAYDRNTGSYLVKLTVDVFPGVSVTLGLFRCKDNIHLYNFLETMLGRSLLTINMKRPTIQVEGIWYQVPTPKEAAEHATEKPPRNIITDLAESQLLLELNKTSPEVFADWSIAKERPTAPELCKNLSKLLHRRCNVNKIEELTAEQVAEYRKGLRKTHRVPKW